jgi:hypothetical protein
MDALDPRHGTTRGHAAGCRLDCCREARNTDERRRRKQRQVLGIHRRVDATGTARRIHALMALGWPSREIALRCGWTTGEAVLEVSRRTWVYNNTRATIARVYDELSMTPGPSASTRRRAALNGWLVPLMWDDIDRDPEPPETFYSGPDIDPVVVMRLLEGHRIKANHAEREEAIKQWVADGGTKTELCNIHGWAPGRYQVGLRLIEGGAA